MATDIPEAVRRQVHNRDRGACRFCGSFADAPHLHHIAYRSQGGRHVVENLATLHHWCHSKVHSNKALYAPLLAAAIAHSDGLNVLQLLRWARAAEAAARV